MSASGVSRISTPLPPVTSDVRALSFTGGYVTLGVNSLPANNAAQTISLWYRGAPDGNSRNMIAMSNLASGSAVQLGYRGTNLVAWSYGGGTLVSLAAPTDSNWHHLAYTYDGTTDSLYLDGALSATATASAHQTATPSAAYLGTYNGTDELWNGNLDEVRIYSRAISGYESGCSRRGPRRRRRRERTRSPGRSSAAATSASWLAPSPAPAPSRSAATGSTSERTPTPAP